MDLELQEKEARIAGVDDCTIGLYTIGLYTIGPQRKGR